MKADIYAPKPLAAMLPPAILPKRFIPAPTPLQWVSDQLRSGVKERDILLALSAQGHEFAAARQLVDRAFSAIQQQEPVEEEAGPVASEAVERAQRVWAFSPPRTGSMPAPHLEESPPVLRTRDREVRVLMNMRLPRVVVLGNLLSYDECEALIELARPRLQRSATTDMATGGEQLDAGRTSDGAFLRVGEGDLVERIEQRIADLLNWPVDHGEGLQVLRYGVGAEYRPHQDYFDPERPGSAPILKRGGQRLATLVMYLNTPELGGATTFPDAGVEVAAQKGGAVFFSYERPSPDQLTRHAGAPVLRGEKWVATKWLRERQFS